LTYTNSNSRCAQEGDRAIYLAIRNRDYKMVEFLIEHGADINTPNYSCFTPLKTACKQQDFVMVNLLLDRKVSV
ncbi:unnamed protein product, partial [Choristocarpus tenellus]